MFHSDSAFATLTSQTLTHEQKLMNLAKEAENAFDVLDIPPRTRHFFETGAINDLFEGHAPYRPRYILQMCIRDSFPALRAAAVPVA